MTSTIGRILLDILIETNGIPCPLWGVCGAAWYPFNDEIQEYENKGLVKYYGISNESSGGFMATYYGNTRNEQLRIGTLFTTAGPGTTQAITAITSAFYEESAFLAVCSVPSNTNFQFIDTNIMSTITKATFTIDASVVNVTQVIRQAIETCHQGTSTNPGPGPVVLFIYKNMFDTIVPLNQQLYIPQSLPNYTYTQVYDSITPLLDSSMKIVVRIGSRISPRTAFHLAELSNRHSNIVISMTYSISSIINHIWDPSRYPRLVVEGPLSTFTYNNIYSQADRVFQIGIGVVYSLIEFMDVTMIPDIPWPTTSLLWSFFDELQPYSQSPSASLNINVGDVNIFADSLIIYLDERMNPSQTSWNIPHTQETIDFGQLLFGYYNQQQPSTLTPSTTVFTSATGVASTLLTLYFSQTSRDSSPSPFVISDNNLYIVDIGAASFIGGQLIRHEKQDHLITFCQFSPIGCSPSALAGRLLLVDKYDDCFLILGDGGFLNVANFVIDLNNMLNELGKRCLLVFADDQRYSNVAIAEEQMFGSYTSMTSTAPLQINVSATTILQAMVSPQQTISITEQTQNAIWNGQLSQFIEQWYTKAPGFTHPGVYLISLQTSSIPVFLTYTLNIPSSSS